MYNLEAKNPPSLVWARGIQPQARSSGRNDVIPKFEPRSLARLPGVQPDMVRSLAAIREIERSTREVVRQGGGGRGFGRASN